MFLDKRHGQTTVVILKHFNEIFPTEIVQHYLLFWLAFCHPVIIHRCRDFQILSPGLVRISNNKNRRMGNIYTYCFAMYQYFLIYYQLLILYHSNNINVSHWYLAFLDIKSFTLLFPFTAYSEFASYICCHSSPNRLIEARLPIYTNGPKDHHQSLALSLLLG